MLLRECRTVRRHRNRVAHEWGRRPPSRYPCAKSLRTQRGLSWAEPPRTEPGTKTPFEAHHQRCSALLPGPRSRSHHDVPPAPSSAPIHGCEQGPTQNRNRRSSGSKSTRRTLTAPTGDNPAHPSHGIRRTHHGSGCCCDGVCRQTCPGRTDGSPGPADYRSRQLPPERPPQQLLQRIRPDAGPTKTMHDTPGSNADMKSQARGHSSRAPPVPESHRRATASSPPSRPCRCGHLPGD